MQLPGLTRTPQQRNLCHMQFLSAQLHFLRRRVFPDLTGVALHSRGRVQEQGDWACSALKASTATACAGCYPRIGACRISFACFGRRLWRTSIKRLGGVQWYLLMQDFSRRATRVASLHKVAWRSTGHLAGGEGKPPDPLHPFDSSLDESVV